MCVVGKDYSTPLPRVSDLIVQTAAYWFNSGLLGPPRGLAIVKSLSHLAFNKAL